MATYIVQFRFTEQGARNIKDSPKRVEAAKQTFQQVGATVKQFYAVLGPFDTMFIVEAPDNATVAKAVLAVAAAGNVRTETFPAFTEAEFRDIAAVGS